MANFFSQYLNTKSIIDLAKTNQLNNNLLIPIYIKDMIDMAQYNVEIGNKSITTKSYIELEEWTRYWGELTNDEKGGIKISNIQKKPKILQNTNFPFAFDLENLEKILSLDDTTAYMQEFLLDNLMQCEDKDEFYFLSNLLLSINFDVLSIPFVYNNTNNILQIKKNAFAISTNHLGLLAGEIDKKSNILNIKTLSQVCLKPLGKYLKNSYNTKLQVSNNISLLFNFRSSALSLKI